jgi:hypothetical protein
MPVPKFRGLVRILLILTTVIGPVSVAGAAEPGKAVEVVKAGGFTSGVGQLFRAYEPMEAGYTFDQREGRDDRFLDATISFMVPILHSELPQARVERTTRGNWDYKHPRFYFAMTDRFSQYIFTRESSPVINKRFNPLFSLRWWTKASPSGLPDSEDSFFELVYAHESNGQSIDSDVQYQAQVRAYIEENSALSAEEQLQRAHRSARDNISRGWDYWGVQFARAWAPDSLRGTVALRAKANFYIGGALQRHIEQYNTWEVDPLRPTVGFGNHPRARADFDGLSVRVAYTSNATKPANDGLDGRCALTWTTGYDRPLHRNTVKFEVGVRFKSWPFLLWVRSGYNSDLIDYYRRDNSFGAKVSFWRF